MDLEISIGIGDRPLRKRLDSSTVPKEEKNGRTNLYGQDSPDYRRPKPHAAGANRRSHERSQLLRAGPEEQASHPPGRRPHVRRARRAGDVLRTRTRRPRCWGRAMASFFRKGTSTSSRAPATRRWRCCASPPTSPTGKTSGESTPRARTPRSEDEMDYICVDGDPIDGQEWTLT